MHLLIYPRNLNSSTDPISSTIQININHLGNHDPIVMKVEIWPVRESAHIYLLRSSSKTRSCGRIPGAFCCPLFVDADLRNFNAVRRTRTRFYDLIQIVVLICLRIVRAIRGTNSHHSRSRMWGLTVFWTARYDVGSGLRHLRFVQLWSNEVSYRKSKRTPLLKIILAASRQSFMRIEEKNGCKNRDIQRKVGRDTIGEILTL